MTEPNPPPPAPLRPLGEPNEPPRTTASSAPGSKRRRNLAALGGLVLGTAISAAVWIPFWNSGAGSPLPMFLLVGAKVVAGTICVVLPNWRAFGVGLLCSIATGFLIFFGACAMNFKVD
jgi:hypothetical protein